MIDITPRLWGPGERDNIARSLIVSLIECTLREQSLLDHLISAGEERGRNRETEGPCSPKVDH